MYLTNRHLHKNFCYCFAFILLTVAFSSLCDARFAGCFKSLAVLSLFFTIIFFLVVMFISSTLLECDERAHWNQLAHWIPSLISIQWDFTEDKIYIFVGWTNLRDTINWMPGTWLLLSLSPIQIVSSCSSWCIFRRFTIKNWNGTNKTN